MIQPVTITSLLFNVLGLPIFCSISFSKKQRLHFSPFIIVCLIRLTICVMKDKSRKALEKFNDYSVLDAIEFWRI